MNFTKLLTSCNEKRQGVLNQAFNLDYQEACAHQTNVEEAKNGASQTLAKPINNKDTNENQLEVAPREIQMKTSDNKSGTTRRLGREGSEVEEEATRLRRR